MRRSRRSCAGRTTGRGIARTHGSPRWRQQTQSELYLWPYEEARRVADRVWRYEPGRPAIFQSGFGPSGMPHLGTMAEVLRPSYVRKAFEQLKRSGANPLIAPSRLIVFIDDMDGLRKVPENIPNREATTALSGRAGLAHPRSIRRLPSVSFAAHMMSLLGKFLAPVEIEYELMQSTEMYGERRIRRGAEADPRAPSADHPRSSRRRCARRIAPDGRPIMPVCPQCGQINSTLVTAYHPDRATVEFSCERSFGGAHRCGFKGEQSCSAARPRSRWKVDWALRWYALKVDYELYGKDLIDSARLSGQILKVLGGRPPIGFPFEMFLDEEGHKVSKSVGRGVAVDQWRRYAPIEVLKYFLLLNPRRARKLFLEAIPQYVDEYLDALRAWSAADDARAAQFAARLGDSEHGARALRLGVELRHDHEPGLGAGHRGSRADLELSRPATIRRSRATPKPSGWRKALMECALNFYRDFIEPTKQRYMPQAAERDQLRALAKLARQRTRTPRRRRSRRRSTISGARTTTSRARFFRCSIACCWARSAARASARSSSSPQPVEIAQSLRVIARCERGGDAAAV